MKKISSKRSLVAIMAALSASLSPLSAHSAAIEEIVITAQKRAENLQDVALAVSAFNGASLAKAQIFDVSDLASRAPAFAFQSLTPMESELIIRGIGTISLDSASADSSVAVFQDETYIGRRGSATMDFFDLERIEVLRGPQGTLYGKNVVGGAVNIYTAKPEFETSGQLRTGYGNYNTLIIGGHITGALTDDTAGRLSIHSRDREKGFARNHQRGEDLETLQSYAIRAQTLTNLSASTSLHIRADAGHDESSGMARHAVDDPFRAGIGPISAFHAGSSIRDNWAPFKQGLDRDLWGISATVEHDFAFGTLTSITALREADATNALDQFGTTSPPSFLISLVTEHEEYQALSQEFRLTSSDESAIKWVAGVYLLREETDRTDGQVEESYLWTIEGPGGLGDLLTGAYLYEQNNVTENYAVFGQLSYSVTDNVNVTVGGRYTVDKKDYWTKATDLSNDNGTRGATPLLEGYPKLTTDEQWEEFTPRLAAEWTVSDDALVYASVSKGFKGGGWQGKPANAAGALISYDPETAWNYEVGVKSEWLDNRLRVNAAAFFIDYEALQIQRLNQACLCLVVENAANAESSGIEIELQAAVSDNLMVTASGSYLDTEYIDFISGSNDFSGNFLQRTPESQYTVGARYLVPLADGSELSLRFDYTWQDEIFWTPNNTNFEEAYGKLSSRIAFTSGSGRYELAAWGKNLTDEEYRTRAGPVLGDESSTWAPPRTYGVELVVNFD